MKVGLVIYGPLDHRSGGYLYDAKIVQYLRMRGDRVRVYSLPESDYSQRFAHAFRFGFWRRLSTADLDVLLQDELNHPSLLIGNRWLRSRVAYPIVSIVHHLYADEWPSSWKKEVIARLERTYLSSVDAFVCNSETTLRRVRRLGLLKPAIVARPGGDRLGTLPSEEDIRQRAHAPGPLRILFLGNVIPRKRLEIVLQALTRLPEEVGTLRVVGSLRADPAYAARMRQLSEALGLANRVAFCGRISDAALRAELQEGQVLIVPSQHEGFGIVYLEAMAHGIAVIANEESTPNNLIHQNANGFLLNGEPAEFASTICNLYNDRTLLERISLNGRETFDAHPTWDETGAAVRGFLQQLV